MTTIPQNDKLLKNLFELMAKCREVTGQQRVWERLELLLLSELFVFGRHTITQLLMSLGLTEQDWSAWYRLFSEKRFKYDQASEELFRETLQYVGSDELYVVVGDATQTPRSSRKMEGEGWLGNLRTPPFMIGIHAAQRWFNRPLGFTHSSCWRATKPLGWFALPMSRRAGGEGQHAGLLPLYYVAFVLPCGDNPIFDPSSHQHRMIGSENDAF